MRRKLPLFSSLASFLLDALYLFILIVEVRLLSRVVLVSVVQQNESVYIYIYPFLLRFPSHLGHHRSLSRDCCAKLAIIISYLFYTCNLAAAAAAAVYICQSQSSNSSGRKKSYNIAYIWQIDKGTDEYLQSRNRVTNVENKLTVTKKGKRECDELQDWD